MNVTPSEMKMITLQRVQGVEQEGLEEKRQKKNHFDGLWSSWDNLVTFWTGAQLTQILCYSSNSLFSCHWL